MFVAFAAYLQKKLGMEFANNIRYPPYTAKKEGWLKFLMGTKLKKGPKIPWGYITLGLSLVVGYAAFFR